MSQGELPKEIRDELRMTAALRCYSIMRSGGAKSLNAQYEYMSSLFHGDEPSIPSNIKMLSNGVYLYKPLYDVSSDNAVVLAKSATESSASPSNLSLKVTLSRNKSRLYFSNIDILYSDLEKKGRNGSQLVSGRNLLDLAKKGTANYRKALSFAVKKFDLETMHVKESGNTIDDVIEYIRIEMYQIHLKDEARKKKTIVIDGVDDLDDNQDLEDDYLSSKKDNNASNEKKKSTEHQVSKSCDIDKEVKKEMLEKASTNKSLLKKKEAGSTSKKPEKSIVPPPGWFFPSWFSFLTYGPFVDKDKRLSLLEISDASKNVVKSRAQKRKSDKIAKQLQRANDSSADRGFSTDQKIQLEMIDLTRQQTTDRSRESILMGLCVQEAALTKQIDRAERMAERLAPNDIEDVNNKWWNKVKNLIHKQELIVTEMANLNNLAIVSNKGGSNNSLNSNKDSSTLTKCSSESFIETSNIEVLSDLSKDSTTSNNSAINI